MIALAVRLRNQSVRDLDLLSGKISLAKTRSSWRGNNPKGFLFVIARGLCKLKLFGFRLAGTQLEILFISIDVFYLFRPFF